MSTNRSEVSNGIGAPRVCPPGETNQTCPPSRLDLRVGVGEGRDDGARRHTGNVLLSHLPTDHPDEHVRTHQHL